MPQQQQQWAMQPGMQQAMPPAMGIGLGGMGLPGLKAGAQQQQQGNLEIPQQWSMKEERAIGALPCLHHTSLPHTARPTLYSCTASFFVPPRVLTPSCTSSLYSYIRVPLPVSSRLPHPSLCGPPR